MNDSKKEQAVIDSLPDLDLHFTSFGERLRELRKEKGLSQDEFAKILGTSKQILSRYELGQRSPKIEQVSKYAEKLKVSVDYLLGDSEAEAMYSEMCGELQGKPFYEIFKDITVEMGLNISDIVRITGLTDKQVRTIIIRRMKDAPLPIAMQLSEKLNVPLEVWAGGKEYMPSELSANAYEVARAYDKANLKDRNTARLALNLETVKE
ncbi:MAG: helix-turn-helix domain-containing protein [Clostridia bacterium]|nr:helix-turn-helix domain-containing protein [Clostridia bacterium]